MANILRGNDLRALGFPEGRAIGLALAQLQRKHLKKLSQTDQLALLAQLMANPHDFLTHLDWSHTAAALLPSVAGPAELYGLCCIVGVRSTNAGITASV